jgi:16S rRNA (guanine1207-N2)-methyltransferase
MPHYYDEKPDSAHARKRIEARISGINLIFHTDSGVFSRNQLDFGTHLLIQSVLADARENGGSLHGKLLDLGCGYGAVGIALKRAFPALSVVMVDINNRALELTRENAQDNLIHNPDIRQSDGFSAINQDEYFDFVLTNPPIRAGKKTVYSFFDGALLHLRPGGYLYVVIQKKQGALSAQERLMEIFNNCEVVARKSGYCVLKCVRSMTL